MAKFITVESSSFPCPECKHPNRPSRRKIESVKLLLSDKMSRCQECGAELKKGQFDLSKIPTRLMNRARRELLQ
jgi:uncharacterized protein with PIN domain